MILPTKRLGMDRALLGLGADLIKVLEEPMTISRLWYEFQQLQGSKPNVSIVSYDWFVLCLDFLNAIHAIELSGGTLRRRLA